MEEIYMLVLKPFEATVGANGGCYMKRGMTQNPWRAEDAQGREDIVKLLVEQKNIYSICTLHSRRPTVQKIQFEVLSLFKEKTASRSNEGGKWLLYPLPISLLTKNSIDRARLCREDGSIICANHM